MIDTLAMPSMPSSVLLRCMSLSESWYVFGLMIEKSMLEPLEDGRAGLRRASRRLSPLGTGLPLIEWHFYDIV